MVTKIRASRDDSRALFEACKLPWPDVPMEFNENIDGPFVRADLTRVRELTVLQRITQPSTPSRLVPAKTEIITSRSSPRASSTSPPRSANTSASLLQ